MKDYSKMSDFEINKAVAINRGGYQGCVEHMEHGVKESNRDSHGILYVERDYCNNPADAWQIIVDSGISIIKCKNCADDWSAEKITDISDDDFNIFHCQSSHSYNDNNPLRAAMIVYLMMKDEEK